MSTLPATSTLPMPSGHSALSPLSLFFAMLGAAGMAALWVVTAMFLQRHSAWMALLTAADIALLLRIAGTAPGRGRGLLCVAATGIGLVAANWGIAATHTGRAFGYGPMDAMRSLGVDLAWTLTQLGNHGAELALYALALVLAWWLGR